MIRLENTAELKVKPQHPTAVLDHFISSQRPSIICKKYLKTRVSCIGNFIPKTISIFSL